MKQEIRGHISQIIGPVIDISFEASLGSDKTVMLPSIHDAVRIRRNDGRILIAEIQQHIGEKSVRSVAMDSTDGLCRGLEVVSDYMPISMPIG